ncbi:MAG: mechanosensitive ion channel domain-containing protein, partial [Alcanivoracaceae bacterium]|nr:mechanosensitive ion channel domain-containing protein [Alcanivoracaceae bacterium]
TVSKIRIRATTIVDFDRKEIIVPNKTFVTDQLVNWTLTDPVTRITIKVGFAYGSDLEKARQVLLQAARENSRVMKDPEPQVLFMAFGASTLDHEMRVHVRELSDRLPGMDELNRRVDALCKEHGLEIAFNQLDVHLFNSNGDSACISSEKK